MRTSSVARGRVGIGAGSDVREAVGQVEDARWRPATTRPSGETSDSRTTQVATGIDAVRWRTASGRPMTESPSASGSDV